MNKLALSVVILMVAGAGSAAAVGCSSSSSTGATGGNDSGTMSDVTTTEDSGTTNADTGTTTGSDSGTAEDTGTVAADSGGPTCTTDASITVYNDTDGGEVVACTSCIGTSCGPQACPCLTDTNMVAVDDAGTMNTACLTYVGCVQGTVGTYVGEHPDAGEAEILGEVAAAKTACAQNFGIAEDGGSVSAGNALISCVGGLCASKCL